MIRRGLILAFCRATCDVQVQKTVLIRQLFVAQLQAVDQAMKGQQP